MNLSFNQNTNAKTSSKSSVIKTTDLCNPQELNKLISGLLFLLPVQGQQELPYLLGEPHTQTNRSAMKAWITKLLKQDDWVDPEELFEFCLKKLKAQLQSWQEVC